MPGEELGKMPGFDPVTLSFHCGGLRGVWDDPDHFSVQPELHSITLRQQLYLYTLAQAQELGEEFLGPVPVPVNQNPGGSASIKPGEEPHF